MPTPRHASYAAIDPVETVTPPTVAPYWMKQESRKVRTGTIGSVLLSLFYAEFKFAAHIRRTWLLPLQIDLLVLMPGNGGANLRWRFAELCLLVGKEAFLGAG